VTQNARLRALPRPYDASQKKVLPAKKVPSLAFDGERPMPRRPIALLVLAIASFVLGACTSVTAPTTQNDSCRSGYILSEGRCVAD